MAADGSGGRDEIARKAKEKLSAIERRSALSVVREYAGIAARLRADIETLLLQIAVAQSQGEATANFFAEKNRLKKLLDAVSFEMKSSARRLADLTVRAANAAVNIAAEQTQESIELAAPRAAFEFDAAAVEQVARAAADGSKLNLYFSRLDKPLRAALFNALSFGVATGAPNNKIAAEIARNIKTSAANALTIVRTETLRAYRSASVEFYTAAGIKKYRWLSALDLNTCAICWRYHGRIFSTATKPFLHINCRCSIVPVLPGDPAVETGIEKFALLNDAQRLTILGKGRFEKYQSGAARLPDLVGNRRTVLGNMKFLINVGDL